VLLLLRPPPLLQLLLPLLLPLCRHCCCWMCQSSSRFDCAYRPHHRLPVGELGPASRPLLREPGCQKLLRQPRLRHPSATHAHSP
jgi:hypothetical protein